MEIKRKSWYQTLHLTFIVQVFYCSIFNKKIFLTHNIRWHYTNMESIHAYISTIIVIHIVLCRLYISTFISLLPWSTYYRHYLVLSKPVSTFVISIEYISQCDKRHMHKIAYTEEWTILYGAINICKKLETSNIFLKFFFIMSFELII